MIEEIQGSILQADTDVLVNPVNCVGVMGKGLALQFKLHYPVAFLQYRQDCQSGRLKPGRITVCPIGDKKIVHFPTKNDWRDPSRLEYIQTGLVSLVKWMSLTSAQSVAIPALGCGLGNLSWPSVRPLIYDAFRELPDVRVLLYPPHEKGRP